jgi:micrococcal nuclease
VRVAAVIGLVAVAALVAVALASRGRDGTDLHGSVVRVVDGDTVRVAVSDGTVERVRLIGIDTPELGTCRADAATRAARMLAGGRAVVLEGDATQAVRDRHGRLLAYVLVRGERDLGLELLERGLARVFVYDRPFDRLSAYRRAEARGRTAPNSIWTCPVGG